MNRFTCFIIILFFFSLSTVSGQDLEWNNSYGGSGEDIPTRIRPTQDGGYIIVGYSSSQDGDIKNNKGGNDYWVIKINKSGVVQWQTNLGGSSNHDYAYSVVQAPTGDYLVTGSSFSLDGDIKNEKKNKGADDFWVVLLAEGGKIKKQYNIGGFKKDICYAVDNTKDGGFITAGMTQSSDQDIKEHQGKSDFMIAKLKANGKRKWVKTFGGSESETAYDIKSTDDGGYIVVGETNSSNGHVTGLKGSYDFWVVKLTDKGNLEWQSCFGGSGDDVAKSVIPTNDGGYLVAGETNSNDGQVKGNHGAFDIWVVKVSSGGSLQWAKTFGGNSFDFTHEVINDGYGGYIIVGGTNTPDPTLDPEEYGSTNAFIVKIAANGDLMWQKTIGGNYEDEAKSAALVSDNGILIACESASVNGDLSPEQAKGDMDYWVVKMSDNNQKISVEQMAAAAEENRIEVMNAMIKTRDNGYVGVGYVEQAKNKDMFVKKYDINGNTKWVQRFGGAKNDVANSIVQTSDGFLLVGESESDDTMFVDNKGDYDAILLKLDNDGNQVWIKHLGGTSKDVGNFISNTKDNNYILAGASKSNNGDLDDNYGNMDYWVVKLSANGSIIWQHNLGGSDLDVATKVIETVNENYIVVGYSQSSNGLLKENKGVNDGWAIEIDKDGKVIWQKNYGGKASDRLNDIIPIDATHYILLGNTQSENDNISKIYGGDDMYVLEVDLFGEIVWEDHYGGEQNDDGRQLIKAKDGGFIVVGSTNSNDKDVQKNFGQSDGWVAKMDRKGKIQWSKNYGETFNDGFNSIIELEEGIYLLGGYKYSDRKNATFMIEEVSDTQ